MANTLRAHGGEPKTLVEAHELVGKRRPKLDAEPLVWAAFHRHCSEVYAAVAKVDAAHRHEAQCYAGLEIRRAREIEDALIKN